MQSQRFFKTGPGQYGEGDLFLGIRVPVLHRLAKELAATPLDETITLLQSPYHEARMLALFLMIQRVKPDDDAIYRAYLGNTDRINNWDLVDSSAAQIVGTHLFTRNRGPLYKLAKSKNLWERRIAIIATFHFIRRNDFAETLALAELLLDDPEDLLHKAVGWMLREIGNRDLPTEEAFLLPRYHHLPRTLLRYAIERFPESRRLAYLRGTA